MTVFDEFAQCDTIHIGSVSYVQPDGLIFIRPMIGFARRMQAASTAFLAAVAREGDRSTHG